MWNICVVFNSSNSCTFNIPYTSNFIVFSELLMIVENAKFSLVTNNVYEISHLWI